METSLFGVGKPGYSGCAFHANGKQWLMVNGDESHVSAMLPKCNKCVKEPLPHIFRSCKAKLKESNREVA